MGVLTKVADTMVTQFARAQLVLFMRFGSGSSNSAAVVSES